MQTPPLVSVITVNYNGGQYLLRSVAATLASTVSVHVWVVDNGSEDGSLQALRVAYGQDPRLQLIENGANLGFAGANNVALRRIKSPWILLLNPDCFVAPDTIQLMLDAVAAQPEVGMAGCLICNPDGSEQAGCRRTLPTPWTGLAQAFYLNHWLPSLRFLDPIDLMGRPLPNKSAPVEAISGAFMLLRRVAIVQVGFLDEGYFLHCEDLDWCQSFRQAGWRILFVPDVKVIHYKGACSNSRPIFVLWHKHRGMVRFYWKFLSYRYSKALNWFVVTGVWLRFLIMVPVEIAISRRRRGITVQQIHDLPPPVAMPMLPIFAGLQNHHVLVTGGTGFIGIYLVNELLRQGAKVRILYRTAASLAANAQFDGQVEWVHGDLVEPLGLSGVCAGIETIFHLASSAHLLDNAPNQVVFHHQITEMGTARLLQEAEAAGVRCMVFVSSVKAMGEENEQCLDETSPEAPETAYGIAKLHAERLVLRLGQRTGMRATVLRLPLVYGPGNKGNLPRMIQAINSGHFPPLPRVTNRRSMVHVYDVVQAALLAAVTANANGKIYLVTDGEVYSSADIERLIRIGLGKLPPRWTIPMWLLRLAARVGDVGLALGLSPPLHTAMLRKLFGSAWYSNARIQHELGYRPHFNIQRTLPEIIANLDR